MTSFQLYLIKVILAAVAVLVTVKWAFLPHGRLPRFRVAYTRLRLRLRLHPGRGHASALELWLRWGRFAAFRSSSRSRHSLGFWDRALHPSQRCARFAGDSAVDMPI